MSSGRAADEGQSVVFFRRQLVLVLLAGGVVLGAVVAVAAVTSGGSDAAHAALRPTADGSGVRAVSPVADASRTAVWAVVAALLAVAGVLVLAVDHVFRVARFAVATRNDGGTYNDHAASPDTAQEAC